MYIIVFAVVYFLVLYRIRTETFPYSYTKNMLNDFFFWLVLGVLIGGRLGYVVFYDLAYFMRHPLAVISPIDFSDGFAFTGIYGMSYHGGLIGVVAVFYFYSRARSIPFWNLVDLFVPAVPLGYTFGRIGNFINGELYGRVTEGWWGMYFPLDPHHSLRHPSQLYEAFFEGLVLFFFLWMLRKKRLRDGYLFAWYLMGYGFFRFFIEYVRQPDAHLGFIACSLTMGQMLSAGMVAAGLIIMAVLHRQPASHA